MCAGDTFSAATSFVFFVPFVVNLPSTAMPDDATSAPSSNLAREHQIFWRLVTKGQRRDDVARAYLAIQAALAYRQETVDVGWLMGALMAEGRRIPDATSDPLGPEGLAYFHWLYEVELLTPGDEDSHHYRLRRRSDGAQTVALLRTAPAPLSLQFQQRYDRQRRALEKKRAQLLADFR